ncbi:MAG TPA: hypothetical protein VMH33_03135 [Solirubrobacterales bacterium]|nr:hypothetical protein [Solirubrobacterales bacterium]
MDTTVLWRSALVQLVAVAVFSIVLAILLPHSFFDTWGWVTGPLAWLLCAAFTARVLGLPAGNTLLGAVLAGLPSIVFVLIGAHWAGSVVAIALFALWCARAPRRAVAAG